MRIVVRSPVDQINGVAGGPRDDARMGNARVVEHGVGLEVARTRRWETATASSKSRRVRISPMPARFGPMLPPSSPMRWQAEHEAFDCRRTGARPRSASPPTSASFNSSSRWRWPCKSRWLRLSRGSASERTSGGSFSTSFTRRSTGERRNARRFLQRLNQHSPDGADIRAFERRASRPAFPSGPASAIRSSEAISLAHRPTLPNRYVGGRQTSDRLDLARHCCASNRTHRWESSVPLASRRGRGHTQVGGLLFVPGQREQFGLPDAHFVASSD